LAGSKRITEHVDRLQLLDPKPPLPPTLFAKKLKQGSERLFQDEAHNYTKLMDFQGISVPIFYGEGTCIGQRALFLSDAGQTLLTPPKDLDEAKLKRLLWDAYSPIVQETGIGHEDLKIDNIYLLRDRIVIADWEHTTIVEEDKAHEHCTYEIDDVIEGYRLRRRAVENS